MTECVMWVMLYLIWWRILGQIQIYLVSIFWSDQLRVIIVSCFCRCPCRYTHMQFRYSTKNSHEWGESNRHVLLLDKNMSDTDSVKTPQHDENHSNVKTALMSHFSQLSGHAYSLSVSFYLCDRRTGDCRWIIPWTWLRLVLSLHVTIGCHCWLKRSAIIQDF